MRATGAGITAREEQGSSLQVGLDARAGGHSTASSPLQGYVDNSPRMVLQGRKLQQLDPASTGEANDDLGTAGLPVVQRMEAPQEDEGVETQWFVRWYAYDGENYTARTIGLPAATGWVKREKKYRGKDVYISIEHLPRTQIAEVADQVRTVIDEHTPLLGNIRYALQQHDVEIGHVRDMQNHLVSLNEALGTYLSKGSTLLGLLFSMLGLTGIIAGGIVLSYVTLPAWLVGLVDGLSFLYGMFVLYRWTKSNVLPGFVKLGLVFANALVIVGASSQVLGQAAAYLLDLTETMPFQHITLAALPFALIIEQLIVKMIEKVDALRRMHNRAGHRD